MTVQLHTDLLLRITQFADRQTLAALRLVSKLFSNFEPLYERLFGLEHPNLNITEIQPTSWKELRVQRTLAERNLLNGLFQKELIFTLPQGAINSKTWALQERQLVSYWQNQANSSTFFLYDVQKKQTLSFPVPFTVSPPVMGLSSSREELKEIGGGIYASITGSHNNQRIFLLVKVDDGALTEIQRYTANQHYSSSKWIFCKETNSFCLATTTDNQLKIWKTPESCITKDFDKEVMIAGHFFWDEHSLLMLYFVHELHFQRNVEVQPDGNISVCDFSTLEKSFDVAPPWRSGNLKLQVLQQDQKLTLLSDLFQEACVFEIPSLPQTAKTYEPSCHFKVDASSRPIYLKAKMHYIADGGSPEDMLNHRRLTLATPTLKSSVQFVFPSFTRITPCESQGLPTLLANDGKQVYILNFIPPPADNHANIASKVNAFIRKFYKQLLSVAVVGATGLLALFLWKKAQQNTLINI